MSSTQENNEQTQEHHDYKEELTEVIDREVAFTGHVTTILNKLPTCCRGTEI